MGYASNTPRKYFIIPIFIPFGGCPHRCVFCNQHIITATTDVPGASEVSDIIGRHLKSACVYEQKKGLAGDEYITEVAFYGGNFAGLSRKKQLYLLNAVLPYIKRDVVSGIRISSRPDSILAMDLELMRELGVKTVEVGVQSMSEEVLERAHRGHTAGDSSSAVRALKEHGFKVGVQLMPGLPGDTVHTLKRTVLRILEIKPDFIRIYPTLVLRGTPLADMCKSGQYKSLDLVKAIWYSYMMFIGFESHDIRVIRMGLQTSDSLRQGDAILAGPYHPAFGQLVLTHLFWEMAMYCMEHIIKNDIRHKTGGLVWWTSPRDFSSFLGCRRMNILRLSQLYKTFTHEVRCDNTIARGALAVNIGTVPNHIAAYLSKQQYMNQ